MLIKQLYQAKSKVQSAVNAYKQDTLPGVLIEKKIKMALTVVE
jgi:hypothetical protein